MHKQVLNASGRRHINLNAKRLKILPRVQDLATWSGDVKIKYRIAKSNAVWQIICRIVSASTLSEMEPEWMPRCLAQRFGIIQLLKCLVNRFNNFQKQFLLNSFHKYAFY